MAEIRPEEVRALAAQLKADSVQLSDLAQTMPGKVQRMEEGAAGLHAAVSTSDALNDIMRALRQVAERLSEQQAFLNQVEAEMDRLISM